MKASDYLASFLADKGITHAFGLQGGAVVHLFDSLEKLAKTKVVYCHHEQTCSLAATAHSKYTGKIGCSIVTTGPACTNAMTGLLAAWQDSIPVIFISGQTRVEHTSYGKPVRQVGSQEFNVLDIVRPITKYARLVERASDLPKILHEASVAATSGRPGPVWIDFPVNLQWENVEAPKENEFPAEKSVVSVSDEDIDYVQACLQGAKSPVVLAGYGIRLANAVPDFIDFIERNGLPFVTSWTASDFLPTDHPLNGGIIGVAGQRGANKIIFSSDLIVCIGGHFHLTQTSTLTNEYAPKSRKIVVNIDKDQLENLSIHTDRRIHSDARQFFEKLNKKPQNLLDIESWRNEIKDFKKLNDCESVLKENEQGNHENINSNYFNELLTKSMPNSATIVVDGGGTALYTGFQSSTIKAGQRIICASAISAMGTGLPDAIGVAFASGKEVYCIIGDGSLMLNLQEFETIAHHQLPIKVIVYNNHGYLAIKHTQQSFLDAKFCGTDPGHGISVPPIEKIAACFGIDFIKVHDIDQVPTAISDITRRKGPVLVEVSTFPLQPMKFQQGYIKLADGRFAPHDLSEMKPFI